MRAGRKPGSAHPAQLAEMAHSKVVNAAYFSPATGGKVLTTCIGAHPPSCWPLLTLLSRRTLVLCVVNCQLSLITCTGLPWLVLPLMACRQLAMLQCTAVLCLTGL